MALIPALSGGGSEPIDWGHPIECKAYSYTAQSAEREEYYYYTTLTKKPRAIVVVESGVYDNTPRNFLAIYDVENENSVQFVLGSSQAYPTPPVTPQTVITFVSATTIVFRVTGRMSKAGLYIYD